MPQRVRKEQQQRDLKGVVRTAPFFKYGATSLSTPAGDVDLDLNTGVTKFPNAIIASGAYSGGPSASHNGYIRGAIPYQGGTNIQISVHAYSDISQTQLIRWWAIGY